MAILTSDSNADWLRVHRKARGFEQRMMLIALVFWIGAIAGGACVVARMAQHQAQAVSSYLHPPQK